MRITFMAALMTASTLAFNAGAIGQVTDDAKASLTASAEAFKKMDGVTFKAKKSGTGMLKDIIDASGTVKLWRPKAGAPVTWMVEGRLKQPGKNDKKIMMTGDGTVMRWLDWEKNTLFERPVNDSTAQTEWLLVQQILVPNLVSDSPFDRELGMAKVRKVGVDNVNGEVVEVVEAMPADEMRNTTWSFAVSDRLPRRLELGTGKMADKIQMITEITEVKTGQKFTEKDFEITKPTGFIEDRSAPAPAVPDPTKAAPNQPVSATPAPAPKVDVGLPTGAPAPAFSIKDTSGKDVSLSSMKGKVVVLQFWGSMFKKSTANMADLAGLAKKFDGKPVAMVGLACRELNDKSAPNLWSQNKMPYPLAVKADAVAGDYKVSGYPTYYVIGPDGNIAAAFQDFPGEAALSEAITAALPK